MGSPTRAFASALDDLSRMEGPAARWLREQGPALKQIRREREAERLSDKGDGR